MSGRARNPAFFRGNGESLQNQTDGQNLKKILRLARSTGALNLSSKNLNEISPQVFDIAESLDPDEKFWEMNPLTKLDCSFNSISSIPASISKLPELLFLKLRNNKIESLSDEVYSLIKLKHVDLANNKLAAISPLIYNLHEVRELFLCFNVLGSIPTEISGCEFLQLLELNDNRLTSLPIGLFTLQNLTKLNISNNKITDLHPLHTMTNLQLLDLRRNKIRQLPDLSNLNALMFLDASENQLSDIPSMPIRGQLARIQLSMNQIPSIPYEKFLCLSASLAELHINDNKITVIPSELGYLYNLKVLDISNNDVSDIPAPIGYMKSLQRLIIDGNPLRTIRRSIGTTGAQAGGNGTLQLKKFLRTRGSPLADMQVDELEEVAEGDERAAGVSDRMLDERLRNLQSTSGALDLTGFLKSGSNSIPFPTQFIDKMSTCRVLSLVLSGNGLTDLPSLRTLTTIKAMDLSSNSLGRAVPEALQGVFPPSLTTLTLTGNGLSDAHLNALLEGHPEPPAGSLSVLIASHNNLISITPALQAHTLLKEIQLSNNKITSLQWVEWEQLPRLEILDLSNNKLETALIEPLLSAPSALQSLNLEYNEIKEIPAEFSLFPNLRYLGIYGNPQYSIRSNVIQQGTDAILNVLRLRLPPEAQSPRPEMIRNASATRTSVDKGQPRLSSGINERRFTETARLDEDDALDRLRTEIVGIETRLEDSSLSPSARIAVKKEIAKKRANLLKVVQERERNQIR